MGPAEPEQLIIQEAQLNQNYYRLISMTMAYNERVEAALK